MFWTRFAAVAENQPNPLYKIQSTCHLAAQSVHSTVHYPMGTLTDLRKTMKFNLYVLCLKASGNGHIKGNLV